MIKRLISFIEKFRIIDFFIIILISTVPLLWFENGKMITGHDSTYPLDIQALFSDRFYTWRDGEPFGNDYSHSMGSIFIHSIEAFFSFLGFSLYDSQKLNFIFWFFLIPTSIYLFSHSLKDKIGYRYFPLISAVLYSFNYYLLSIWRLGAGPNFSIYVSIPFVMAIFIKYTEGALRLIPSSILIAFVLSVFNGGGGFGVPLFGSLFILSICYSLFFILQNIQVDIRPAVQKIVLLFLFTLSIYIFLNLYWIWPFLNYLSTNFQTDVSDRGGIDGAINWAKSVSTYTSYLNLFRLQGFPDWYTNLKNGYVFTVLNNPFLIAVSFLFSPLAFLSILLANQKQKAFILFLNLITVASLFFASGIHGPTGILYENLMRLIPGFLIFRSPQYKFISSLYFSYSILISFSLCILMDYLTKKASFASLRKIPGIIYVFLIIGITLIYHFPFLGKNFLIWKDPLSMLVKIPSYVFAYRNWSMDKQSDSENMFLLPRINSNWRVEVYDYNLFTPISLINLINTKPIIEQIGNINSAQNAFLNKLYIGLESDSPSLARLLNILNIKYILLRTDFHSGLSWIMTEPVESYSKVLRKFSKVWENGKWSIYETPNKENNFIYAVKNLTKYYGDKENIAGVLLNDNSSFVSVKDMTGVNPDEIMGGSKVFSANCQSCIMEGQVSEPQFVNSRILPGSLLYFTKLNREQELERNTPKDNVIGLKLGLSLNRSNEIFQLSQREDYQQVVPLIEKLNANLTVIENYFWEHGINYGLYQIALGYLKSEKRFISDAYENIKSDLRFDLLAVLHRLKSIENYLMNKINLNSLSFIRTYNVSFPLKNAEVYFEKEALPLNKEGLMEIPEKILLNDKTYEIKPNIYDGKISLGEFNLENVSDIKIFFPKPSNLYSVRELTVNPFTPKSEMCLLGSIAGFDWKKNYVIFVDSNTERPSFSIYSKFIKRPSVKLTEGQMKFKPDSFIALENNDSQKFFPLKGNDGDSGVDLYFCTSGSKGFDWIKNNIKIYPKTDPVLFFRTSNSVQNNEHVGLKFKRVNQTKYEITPTGIDVPYTLIFNKRFNSGWRISEKENTLLDFNNKYNDKHFTANGYMNAWLIKNHSTKLYLEFYPQISFLRGLIASLLSLIVFILIFIKYRK